MSELRTARPFGPVDQARDELAHRRAADRRFAEKTDRLFEQEAVLALVSDHPVATGAAVERVLAGKSWPDTRLHTQIVNAGRAVRHLREHIAAGKELEEPLLQALHHRLMENIDPSAGQYRVGLTKPILPGHVPADAQFITKSLANTFDWLATASFHEIHPIEQAALVCARILEIQPFATGNIKAAQLLAAAPLVRAGFPPLIFGRADQPLFLRALGLAFLLSMQDLVDLYTQAVFKRMKDGG